MKLKDIQFEKIQHYDPLNERANSVGMVSEWVGRNEWQNAICFGDTKKECIADARRYIEIMKKSGVQ